MKTFAKMPNVQGRSIGVAEFGPKGFILVEVEDNFIAQNRWRKS